ncbi:putative 2og-fe oxygenase [Phaeomoniella chlamydospora]|uniref:Putative 2og-fe oxygenase n=1 Tax=Phaeomoniella chlamydospora TaxID=158046 RepID=A0A0G2E9V2_PHACM|nr:putative 2og-fe oxygenase [Phaeomoniella chlamydospora]
MKLPPFPDVPTAPIASVRYENLMTDADKVFEACSTDGFFYLDLTGHPILEQAEGLRELAVKAFDHPVEEKNKYHLVRGQSMAGYKAAGTRKQTDSTLRPDTTEFFNIYTDHAHGFTPSREYPPDLTTSESWTLIKEFSHDAHRLGNEILSILATQLDISPSEFTSRNIFGNPSGSHIRLTRKFPHEGEDAIGLPSHTDFGSITILFNWLGGLQIQHRGEWKYIQPLSNHAIINLGDATVRFTNGALLSAKHRVVPAPGEQANVDRYSIVYFVRPGDDVLMKPIEKFVTDDGSWKKVAGKFEEDQSTVLTAKEWIRRRAAQLGS